MAMTALRPRMRDWTYRAARRRMIEAGQTHLPQHVAGARMDHNGNRIVDCLCGWTGNGLGWIGHLDSVVRMALDSPPA